MTRVATVTLALLAGSLVTGCAATRRTTMPASAPCPVPPDRAPAEIVCARDASIRSLQARFRAEVEAAGTTRTAEGVLVWRAPGAMRVKLFTLAGITVYDALWTGDGTHVRGVVRQPLAAHDETFDLGPGETLDAPDADLSLVLWALWQPRCTQPPASVQGGTARYTLDPAPARAEARTVTVRDGQVREEILLRRRGAGTTESVVARYDDYDCTAEPPLPRRIEVEAPSAGWRARVTIVEQARDVVLDEALFAVPATASGDAGS